MSLIEDRARRGVVGVWRLWPLGVALLVAAGVVGLGCSSGPVPYAASTQPVPERRSAAPVASRPAVARVEERAAPAPLERAAVSPGTAPVRAASRPATTTTSSGEVVKTVRLFCDSNPTPIFMPNQRHKGDKARRDAAGNWPWVRNNDCYATLRALGCRPVMPIYVGTLNRAFTWADDQGNPRPMRMSEGGGMGVMWAREGNFSDPPHPLALRACTRLAVDPSFYGDVDGPGPRPVMLDIEDTKTVNLVGVERTKENRRAMVRHMIDAVRTVKEESKGKCEVWGYGWFPLGIYHTEETWHLLKETEDLERELAGELGAVCLSLYNWDRVLHTDGEFWFESFRGVTTVLERDWPEFKNRKVCLVQPVWQVIWPKNVKPEHAGMNGKPVPLDLWKRQIDALVKGGWDLYLWTGPILLDDIRPHLEYAARFAK